MNPKELLAKAAETMSKAGMAKKSYCQDALPNSPVCAYGALTRAATCGRTADYSEIGFHATTEHIKRLIDQAAELLAREINGSTSPDEFATITNFNDRESTTAEDMVLHMKRAANDS